MGLQRVGCNRAINTHTSFVNKGPCSQSYGFSSHVWMWEVDHKEGWELKNWCFRTVVLEETLESLLDYKETKPVDLTGNQLWIFIGRADAKAEGPISLLATWSKEPTLWKRPLCWERVRAIREGGNRRWDGWMASFIQCTWVWANSGRSEGQGSLVCCSPWYHKELDMT